MTFAAEEPEQILNQDTRGRVLVTAERHESLLAEYDRSGMSGAKCRDKILHPGVLAAAPARTTKEGKVVNKI
jgi:hypothetical protein